MNSNARITAWVLAAQGGVASIAGAWVIATAVLTPRAPIGRTGDVVGPPDEAVHMVLTVLLVAFGAAIALLGALDLLAGVAFVRRGVRGWMLAACPITAGAWMLVAGWAFLSSMRADASPYGWIATALAATMLSLVHIIALRWCIAAPGASR